MNKKTNYIDSFKKKYDCLGDPFRSPPASQKEEKKK